MAIDFQRLKAWPFQDVVQAYDARDAMAYALSVGVGSSPCDARRLPFVYEGAPGGLRMLPTFALVLGYPGFWMSDPRTGIDATQLVHGENGLDLHRPLPLQGTVVGRSRVARIVDKGAGKGAVVTVLRDILDAQSGAHYATIRHVTFCRAEGGFATDAQPGDEPAAPLPAPPSREPDYTETHATRPEAALHYRLHADPNPLHADPAVAQAAGFPRPILHGLVSYAIAGFSIVRACCEDRPERLKSLNVRFTAPMYPGENLLVRIWRDGSRLQFNAMVPERKVTVLNFGTAEIE